MPIKPGPRILTLDIETSPLAVYTWGIWEQDVGLNQIESDWTILSFSAKWLGDRKVIYHDTGGRGPAKVRDDRALLEKLWALLDEADIVVTQNGVSFDAKKINARLITHGFKPYSPIRHIDTKLVAKRFFAFTSNKLEFMSAALTPTKRKLAHKKFPGFELWTACLKDNPAAWAEMKAYNIRDTVATEALYLKMRPWIDGHPNVAAYSDSVTPACPKCGSGKVQKNGLRTTQTGRYGRYRCLDCGGSAHSRMVESSKGARRALLGN